jgi:hypothetical protein
VTPPAAATATVTAPPPAAPVAPYVPAERPGPRPSTMALGFVFLVLAVAAVVRQLTDVHVDGSVVLIGLLIGIGILFLVGSRRT